MKTLTVLQKILFFLLLLLLAAMAVFIIFNLAALLGNTATSFQWYAAIVFAHLYFWVPVTAVCVALLFLNYRQQIRQHEGEPLVHPQKALKRYIAAFLIASALTVSAFFIPNFLSDIFLFCAFGLLLLSAILLLRQSARLIFSGKT